MLRRAGGKRLVSRAMELTPGGGTVCARNGGPGTAYASVERCLRRRDRQTTSTGSSAICSPSGAERVMWKARISGASRSAIDTIR
jgi:hypothetical protein